LHSLNEELQSGNEELETSKEEIQSMNEELQTVNSQLSGKVEELDAKNTDLRNLFESTRVATIFLDNYGIIRGFTPAVASIYKLIPSDVGRPLTDIVSRLHYSDLRDDMRRVLATLEPLERRVAHEDGATFYLMRVLPYRTPSSAVDGVVVTFVDVSTIARAEHHQRLLVNELNHRVRNMLTVVISMATQTIRGAKSLEEFEKNYLGRVHALAAAYTLLSNESWKAVSLRDVVMEELRPFLTEALSNITVEGPPVPLQPQAALALGMAVHELTTNAVKYGALSVGTGHVSLTWRLEPGPEDQQLILQWIETGGPRVTPPTHRGFGMTLIERGLRQDMSAEVDLDFAPEGVKATLKAPVRPGGDPSVTAGE
jgi:two-component system CheB/CheR fusion protein